VQLAPWHWDHNEGRLGRIEKVNDRAGTVEVAQRHTGAVVVAWQGLAATDETEILGRVRRWLSTDWEPAPAIAALPEIAALVERGGGRLLRGSSFYEDFIKTVLTINANWPATRRMAAALVAEPGKGAFPNPQTVLDYGEERLRERAKLGFRARTVVAATRQMLDDGAITADGEGAPDRLTYDYLLGLSGIGPYAAAHCRVLLHDFSRIPVDSSVVAYLRARYGCGPAEFAVNRSEWGAYPALGYRMARLHEKLAQAVRPSSE
jgi:3-methyladenine DNA glycosylase/8-oxoguanine DNA glycosylase